MLSTCPQLLIAMVFCRMFKMGRSFQEARVQCLKPQCLVSEDVIFFYTWMKRNDKIALTSGQKIRDWEPG